jgi:DNA-directed RNA polymerase subunit RPC12/RpoP
MTQANNQWRETTTDCNHCGGIILQRLAQGGTITADRGYYRCAQCGCEWARDWELIKAGDGRQCQVLREQMEAQEVFAELRELPNWFTPRVWLYLIGGLLLFALLARFGVIAALSRLAFPLLLISVIIALIWYVFRQR